MFQMRRAVTFGDEDLDWPANELLLVEAEQAGGVTIAIAMLPFASTTTIASGAASRSTENASRAEGVKRCMSPEC